MRKSLFLVAIFICSLMSPLASPEVVETQFEDGTTTYTQTFQSTGFGLAGNLTFPYGAEVTGASFDITGAPSTTTWGNLTTNSDFGGAGTSSWSGVPPGFAYGYRSNMEVENDEVTLVGTPTNNVNGLDLSSDATSTGTINNTGGFASNGDHGMIGSSKSLSTISLTSSTSSYRGFVVKDGDTIYSATYTSTSVWTTPTVKRYNATTGSYLGTASVGTCPGYSQPLYTTYDATSDNNGKVWTANYNYRILVEWDVSENGIWTCAGTYSYSYYPVGVDIDEESGRMFLLMYQSSFPNYNRYLYEVNPSSPTQVNGSYLLGTRDAMGDSGTDGAGLYVSLPKIVTNEYSSSRGYHNYFTMNGNLVTKQGKIQISGGGHYGMDDMRDNTFGYQCHYYSQCSSSQRNVIQREGTGVIYDERSITSTSSVVTSKTTSVSKAISKVTVSGMVGYVPDNTSIELEISVDGGTTWMSGRVGQTLNFANAGSFVVWKAYINGTTTETPALDFVSLTYVVSFQSSGYFYLRSNYYSGSAPVAVTAYWNSSTPSGTSLRVEVQDSSTKQFQYSGDTKQISMTSGYIYIYVRYSSTGSDTPVLEDLNIALHSNAPNQVGINIGESGMNGFTPGKEWTHQGTLIGTVTRGGVAFVSAFNAIIPGTGSGTISIPINISSESAGIVTIERFSVTYSINTVNLDIMIPENEILHERAEPYEIVTRHIVGDGANNYIQSATLSFLAQPSSSAPTLEWQDGDIFPSPNDPDDWIEIDSSSWSSLNNGILEIHWRFTVTSEFPDQENVRFSTGCLDTSGTNGFAPEPLMSSTGLRANNSFGLGWLNVRDNDGEVTSNDLETGSWVAAGETLHFQGAMWFADSQDAPKDNAFDVRIAQNGFVHTDWRDNSNVNGSFFISIDMPEIDVESGLTYELQTYNEKDATKVLPANSEWTRTYKVDATAPEITQVYPIEDAYEAAVDNQKVSISLIDSVGDPVELKLFYWVEADHDMNRNGEADPSEYAIKVVRNETMADFKTFTTTIDHSRNPNMGRVSYYWDGGDQAGNPLHYTTVIDDQEYTWESGSGFGYDDATFRSRKDSSAIFTGLDWHGHVDNAPIYAGFEQTISLGLIDANTAIDFEYIDLVFDFEGPNPEVDQQRISYFGFTDTFGSSSEYIQLMSTSNMIQTTNETGMPLILLDFNFKVGWDWPDEEISDLALEYKERGSEFPTRHIIADHTFRVENDLVLDANSFKVNDISEPRTGAVADGSRVRNDDRLEFTGRVVYEGSNVPAPKDAAIVIEVFDGEKIWSDGSLEDDGGYSVEVPLSSAETLRSSPTRTCLISISGIPGKGEDMTGQTVSTTLRVIVDDTAPRVVNRATPVNTIDISANSDLTRVPVEFKGTEDADMTGSKQTVHWVMRDSTRTLTLGAGQAVLGMQQQGQDITWTGTVDLTDGGKVMARDGDWVGFYLTGYDAAGNEFPVVSNSEASPIPELASVDTDFERQWVRLGSVGPQLKIDSISLSDDHVAPGQDIELTVVVHNDGGNTNALFKVSFYEGDDIVPFDSKTLNRIGENEKVPITISWTAKEGVDRLRVVVDPENVIVEVNDDDNYAEHKVEVVYVSYMGWFDSIREQPLVWLFSILSIIVLVGIGVVSSRTAVSIDDGMMYDDEDWEEEEDWEDEEDDDYDDDED